jgi:hypothetical protein
MALTAEEPLAGTPAEEDYRLFVARPALGSDYEEEDVLALYQRGDWHSWEEIIRWLEGPGRTDPALTPNEVVYLLDDLRRLRERGVPFTADPRRAYLLARSLRYRPSPPF